MSEGLRIAVVFPELLGTYGDGGNVVVLRRRLEWRGLGVEIQQVALGDPVPAECDLYLLGGGEDRAQTLAMDALRGASGASGLHRAAERGAVLFCVCAGMQLLGQSITDADGVQRPGLGLLDLDTAPRRRRAIGDVLAEAEPELGLGTLVGFENHLGGTRLGPSARPLATVRQGVGNGAEPQEDSQRGEGVLQGSMLGTYLHGPVLARNPRLADLLLARALGRDPGPLPAEHADPDPVPSAGVGPATGPARRRSTGWRPRLTRPR